MDFILFIFDFILHIDDHLAQIIANYGAWTYLILFLIVFCETGLVVTPFLPGDSLLFAAGAFASKGSVSLSLICLTIFVAAVLGDALNYKIGSMMGPAVWQRKDSKFFKLEYLHKTQKFYEKYGGKAIIIARFIPIIRTFAPFLAGVGSMNYGKFAVYNISGAALWVGLMVGAGYLFGELPFVKNNFSMVIIAIIIISILPAVIEVLRAKFGKNKQAPLSTES